MTIQQIFSTLKESEQRTLQYAHEHGISQHVIYAPGEYIGVNAEHIKYLVIEKQAGNWSIGKVKGHEVLHEIS